MERRIYFDDKAYELANAVKATYGSDFSNMHRRLEALHPNLVEHISNNLVDGYNDLGRNMRICPKGTPSLLIVDNVSVSEKRKLKNFWELNNRNGYTYHLTGFSCKLLDHIVTVMKSKNGNWYLHHDDKYWSEHSKYETAWERISQSYLKDLVKTAFSMVYERGELRK